MTISNPGALPTVTANVTPIKAEQYTAIKDRVVNNYATTGDRDTDIAAPVAGQQCCVDGRPYLYDGTAWRGLPAGREASTGVSTNQGSITTTVDLTNLTVTFTAKASRRYKITAQILAQSTVVTDVLSLFITDGSNTVIEQANCHLGIVNVPSTIHSEIHAAPGAGSITYKLRASRTGSGTMTMVATSTAPAIILVEDIGT